jgi:NAD+ synthase (glutamine-hydrolysing)
MDKWLVMAGAPVFGAPGDIRKNRDAVLQRIFEAQKAGVQMLVLPELCLSGGSCGEMFRHKVLLDACGEALQAIAEAAGGLLCVLGLPLRSGGQVFNTLAIIKSGGIRAFVIKQRLAALQLPFFSSFVPSSLDWKGRLIPCGADYTLDLEGLNGKAHIRFYDDLMFDEELPAHAGERLIIAAPAMMPSLAGSHQQLRRQLARFSLKSADVLLANAGANESTTDQVFAGEALITGQGSILAEALPFSGKTAIADLAAIQQKHGELDLAEESVSLPEPTAPFAPPKGPRRQAWCRDCLEIAAQGLARRMARIAAKSVTLGVSGGLDSAMALLVVRRAFEIGGLDKAGIHACSLPGLGSSGRTQNNARQLIKALDLPVREIDIRGSVLAHFRDIGLAEGDHGTAYENAQARERTQVLMDLANMHGGLMVGTGDLSESALGFTTFGGDHLSMYNVNAGLYKSAIRLIIRQAAVDAGGGKLSDTLMDILDTPISPELLPDKAGGITQQTEEIVGPYRLNDFFLHHFLTVAAGPESLLKAAQSAFGEEYGKDELIRSMGNFFTRFFQSQFKRNCTSDGPQVLDVSLSPRGFYLLPSDASASVWLEAIDQLETLIERKQNA